MSAPTTNFDQLEADLTSDKINSDRLLQYREEYRNSPGCYSRQCYGGNHPIETRRGKLGFYLFTIEAANAEGNGETGPADEYLNDPDTHQYILTHYQVNDHKYRCATLHLHKSGTTSYILKAAKRALKIIKPLFWDSSHIRNDNLTYQSKYGDLCGEGIAPEIYDVGELYIDMDYIPGLTLTDYIKAYIHPRPENQEHLGQEHQLRAISNIDQIFRNLSKHMQVCYRLNRPHLDLSPDNILIQTGLEDEIKAVVLIDFGSNYILSERVGAAGRQWSRAQNFVSPEIAAGLGSGSALSDVYSMGKILLETLSMKALSAQELSGDLDNIWLNYPEFAKIIDDMIAVEPQDRLLNRDSSKPIFIYIGDLISEELKIYKEVRLREISDRRQYLDGIAHFLGPINAVADWATRIIELKKLKLSVAETKRLLKCAFWIVLVHWVVICTFLITLTWFRDKRLCDAGGFCLSAINSPSRTPLSGFLFFSGFLPGRVVAISFSFVIVKYYWGLFSTISVRGFEVPTRSAAKWAERFMRGILFLPFAAILYALVVDPKAWPFCSGIGLLWIGVNNHLMSRLAIHANELLKKDLKTADSSLVTDKLLYFSSWPEMIYLYAAALLLLGVLLPTNVLKDEWFYGLIIVPGINIPKMYMQNCGSDAPPLRSVLERLVAGLRRLERKKAIQAARG